MNRSDLTAKIKNLGIRVRPAVPPEKTKGLEAQLGIKLPEDYALFLTQIGDGWDRQVVKRVVWQVWIRRRAGAPAAYPDFFSYFSDKEVMFHGTDQ